MSKQDWHTADIIAAVKKTTGLSLRKLSMSHNMHHDTCAKALQRPYEKAEQIIAEAINYPAQSIWPSRFNEDGTRKKGLHSRKNSNRKSK